MQSAVSAAWCTLLPREDYQEEQAQLAYPAERGEPLAQRRLVAGWGYRLSPWVVEERSAHDDPLAAPPLDELAGWVDHHQRH